MKALNSVWEIQVKDGTIMRIKIAGVMFVVALLIIMALPLFAGSATVYAHEGKHTSCAGGAQAVVADGFFPKGPGRGPDAEAFSLIAKSGGAAAALDLIHDVFACEPK